MDNATKVESKKRTADDALIDGEPINQRYSKLGFISDGLCMIAAYNMDSQLIINSKHNSFGGFISPRCVVDGGYSSLLITIPSLTQLDQLLELFPPKLYDYKVIRESTEAKSIVLVVAQKAFSPDMFPIEFCVDTLPNKPYGIIHTNLLRFHLSAADVNHLIVVHSAQFTAYFVQNLKAIRAHKYSAERLDATVVGQLIIREFHSFRTKNYEYFVRPEKCPHIPWDFIQAQDNCLLTAKLLGSGDDEVHEERRVAAGITEDGSIDEVAMAAKLSKRNEGHGSNVTYTEGGFAITVYSAEDYALVKAGGIVCRI